MSQSTECSTSTRRACVRRIWRWVMGGVLMVLGCYGLLNLGLCLPWTREAVASKLKDRTGGGWEIGVMTWSPWNGVIVRDIKCLQPDALKVLDGTLEDPIVEVERVQVKLYWSQLIRRQVVFREVTVESPRVTVAVEMLASLASDVLRTQVTSEPDFEPQGPSQPKVIPDPGLVTNQPVTQQGEKVIGKVEVGDSVAANSGAQSPVESAVEAPPKTSSPPRSKRPPVGLPMVLKIKGGSLNVVSVGRKLNVLSMDGLSVDFSLFGEDSKGEMRAERVSVLGGEKITQFVQKLTWTRPYLKCENLNAQWGGVKFSYNVQLGIISRVSHTGRRIKNFPFQVDVIVPAQPLVADRVLDRAALEVRAERIEGRVQCAGLVKHPKSWQANMILIGDRVKVKEDHGGHDIVFDEVVVPAVFRRSNLMWQGVRLIGEDVSILGNGRVSPRGGVLSVTRFVVSPEVSRMVTRGLQGAGLVSHGNQWWSDLDTPDRKMRDLLVSGSIMDPVVDAGYLHRELPIAPLVRKTLGFIQDEMREEKLKLEHSN